MQENVLIYLEEQIYLLGYIYSLCKKEMFLHIAGLFWRIDEIIIWDIC